MAEEESIHIKTIEALFLISLWGKWYFEQVTSGKYFADILSIFFLHFGVSFGFIFRFIRGSNFTYQNLRNKRRNIWKQLIAYMVRERTSKKKIVLVYHIAERSLPFFNLLNEVKSLAVFNGEPLRDKTQKKFRFFRRKYFMTFFIFTEGSKPCTNISNILE